MHRLRATDSHCTPCSYVSTNYFDVMGIRLVAGRAFQSGDLAGSLPVAVVNESMVRRDFGSVPAIGQRVRHQGVWRTIVGVVVDVHGKSLTTDDGAGIYVPVDQHPITAPTFLVRAPYAIQTPSLRLMLRELDAQMVLRATTPLPDAIARSYGAQRYRARYCSRRSAPLPLCWPPLDSTASACARRRGESVGIGIRAAVGGSPSSIVRLLVRDATRGVAAGVLVGFLRRCSRHVRLPSICLRFHRRRRPRTWAWRRCSA